MNSSIDWNAYPNFSKSEFDCKHTGENQMKPDFLQKLQQLRTMYGRPMIITSGYRHPTHPLEIAKPRPGPHTTGRACDIACNGQEIFKIMELAYLVGFTGFGISQREGRPRFLHIDDIQAPPRPNMWSY